MTANAPTFATLFLRVFLPFALAYFLSYIFRGVNAVIFPYLERDIGITAGDLGLLTSAFFLFFAGCQPVLGVMLDRYGPRRVQVVLLAMAAAGSALFGLSLSLGELIVARVLIGLGFAGGLMAAIKAITLWYPPERWGLITGFHMMAGGAGLDGGDPARRMVAVGRELAGPVLLAGRLLPRHVGDPVRRRARTRRAAAPHGTLAEQFRITGTVLTDGFYWRIQPLLAVQQLAFIGCISLWIGPWLRDVGGFADKEMRADIQLYTAAATTLGFAMSGVIATGLPPRRRQQLRLGRHHEHPVRRGVRLDRLRAVLPSGRGVGGVRLPRRLPDPVHAADGRVLPARTMRAASAPAATSSSSR